MRLLTLSTLVLFSSLPVAALATKAPAPATPSTESAASRAARIAAVDDFGSIRDSELRGPALQNGAITGESSAVEHAPTTTPAVERSTAPLSGVLEELVNHQMERNAPAFDRCVAEAKRRNPSLHGQVTLAMTITAKKPSAIVSAVVDGASVDSALSTCLVTSARTLRVSLPDLSFPWSVSLGNAATTGGARAALP